MKEFTRLSNGYTLTIRINEDALLKELDEEIKKYQDLQAKYKAYEEERIAAEENGEEYDDWRWEYDMSSVYGDPECDWCTPDEILKDLEEFKQVIINAVNSDGSKLWDMVELKKNGTFKKNCKPTLKKAINGSYWEDSYGWNARVLRLEPWNDTRVDMKLDKIVLHY